MILARYAFNGVAATCERINRNGWGYVRGAFAGFKRRPVPLWWAHRFYFRRGDARCVASESPSGDLHVSGWFQIDDTDETAVAFMREVDAGLIASLSISFDPNKAKPSPYRSFYASIPDLLEVSLVDVGGDPGAYVNITRTWN